MRRLGPTLAGLALAATTVVAWAGPAAAIETPQFGLEPAPRGAPRAQLREQVRPGHRVTDEVRVWNKSSRPLTLRLSAQDAVLADDGSARLGGTSGVAGWADVGDRVVTLGPRESRLVPFILTAPRNLAGRPSSFALVAEPLLGPDTTVSVVQRLAQMVYVEPKAGVPLTAALGWAAWVAVALLAVVAFLVLAPHVSVQADDRSAGVAGVRA